MLAYLTAVCMAVRGYRRVTPAQGMEVDARAREDRPQLPNVIGERSRSEV